MDRSNNMLNLMRRRMGDFLQLHQRRVICGWAKSMKNPYNTVLDPNLSGITEQNVILEANGGLRQQDRMIKDKRRSLDRALYYSYQAANITKHGEDHSVRALINPNKLKQDYDEK